MRSEEFDKRIKNLIDQREITPSASAWEKLEEKLDNNGSADSSKMRFLYRCIAAAVLTGIVVTSLVLFTGSDPDTVEIVSEEAEVPVVPGRNKSFISDENSPSFVEVKAEQEAGGTESISEPDRTLELNEVSPVLAENNTIPQVSTLTPLTTLQWIPPLKKTQPSGEASEAEIDALLAEARGSIAGENAKRSVSVNAKALLADVEDELDQNFKDRALEALKKGIGKLRSAVAEGNE